MNLSCCSWLMLWAGHSKELMFSAVFVIPFTISLWAESFYLYQIWISSANLEIVQIFNNS